MAVVVGVALIRAGRILAARRSDLGQWEFPGGKVEPDETPEDAAAREISEELGCLVEVTGWLVPEVEIRPGLVLRVATAELVAGEPVPRAVDHDAIRWLAPAELGAVDWLPADLEFVRALG